MSHAVWMSSMRGGSGNSSANPASSLFGTINLEIDPCAGAVSLAGESLARRFCDADDPAASLERRGRFVVCRRLWSLSRNTSRAVFMVRLWSASHACDKDISLSVQSLRRLFRLRGPFIASSFQALHELSHACTCGCAEFSPAQVNASSVCWSGSGNNA